MSNPELEEQIRHATDVQNKYAEILLSKPHVVGVGVGYAVKDGEQTPEVAIIVMVDDKLPEAQLALEDIIPSRLDGVRVDVQQTGSFGAFGAGG